MVRLLGIAFLLFLSHVSLVATKAIPLVPGGSIIPRENCDTEGGECESYDILLDPHLSYAQHHAVQGAALTTQIVVVTRHVSTYSCSTNFATYNGSFPGCKA